MPIEEVTSSTETTAVEKTPEEMEEDEQAEDTQEKGLELGFLIYFINTI